VTPPDMLTAGANPRSAHAKRVAEFRDQHPTAASVAYAGLGSSPWNKVKEKLGLEYTGSVLAFDLATGDADPREAAWKFIDSLKLHSDLANVGDVRSLVVHPATTTHSQSTEENLRNAGISQATVRLSVGIEDVRDIIADLEQGFEQI